MFRIFSVKKVNKTSAETSEVFRSSEILAAELKKFVKLQNSQQFERDFWSERKVKVKTDNRT